MGRWRVVLIVSAALLVLGFATIGVCADGGAMAAMYRTCECRGWEWQLYDRTEADGPRRTLCLGFAGQRRCHQFRGGPEIACPARSQ
jgi:hypothetical protein